MAAAIAGIWNHHAAAEKSLLGQDANPLAGPAGGGGGSGGSGGSGSDSATISANDFLTLLVTEMQNQDPTADTDPNEYINQLVQVNSLEQLIDINQNLTAALGGGTTAPAGSDSSKTANAISEATARLTGKSAGPAGTQVEGTGHKGGAMAAAIPYGAGAVAAGALV